MDSMKSLNTSLPSARPQPPEALLQAFRTAALSVTNLYKGAVTDQNASRQAGYQEALADVLSFLDKENLGLQDGEGWKVRQWATERYDGLALPQQTESDDDKSDSGQRPRSITPTQEQQATVTTEQTESPRTETLIQKDNNADSAAQNQSHPTPMFYFTGNTTTPASDDMQTDEDGNPGSDNNGSSAVPNAGRSTSTTPRGNRTSHKASTQRYTTRTSTKEFNFTTGNKRKFQIPDFFDISNIGPRDGMGGNKRGRIS